MNKAPPHASSPGEACRLAPRACLFAILCLFIAWFIFGLAFVPLVIAPVAGLLAAVTLAAYWRFRREWLASTPYLFLLVPTIGGGVGDALQSIAITVFFTYFPIWLFGDRLAEWAQRDHS